MEALTIMKCLKEVEKYAGIVGLTGISFGGSMSSLASLFCQYDHPVITLVPAHSPVVFADGGLSNTIDYSVFGPIELQGRQVAGQEALRALLSQMTIGKDTTLDIPPVRRVVMQISAVHDAYVLLDPAVEMFDHFRSLPNMMDCELQLWGIFGHRNLYIKRIVEGFDRFSKAST